MTLTLWQSYWRSAYNETFRFTVTQDKGERGLSARLTQLGTDGLYHGPLQTWRTVRTGAAGLSYLQGKILAYANRENLTQ